MKVANKLLYGECWAIVPEKMEAILHAIDRVVFAFDEDRAPNSQARASLTETKQSGIAVLNISGVLNYRAGMFADSSGGQSIERTQTEFRNLLAREDVGSIVLNIDSPGGSVAGIMEFADEIATAKKKVVAIANPTAASAAFWLFSAASEKYVIPSGQVGSVGVIAVHQDSSEAEEKAGLKTTIVSAGKYKSEWVKSPDAEALNYLQSQVDSYYNDFISALAKFNGISTKYVEEHFGQGRMLRAQPAKDNKMVNKVMTFDQLITHMKNRQDIVTKRKDLAARYGTGAADPRYGSK